MAEEISIKKLSFTIMLIFPKGEETVKGTKPIFVFASSKPDKKYRSKVDRVDFEASFAEACRTIILTHKDYFKELARGYRRVITRVPFEEISKYGKPIFVSLDRIEPWRYINESVEDMEKMIIRKIKKDEENRKKVTKIKKRQRLNTNHQAKKVASN